jgi:hypothetical protein
MRSFVSISCAVNLLDVVDQRISQQVAAAIAEERSIVLPVLSSEISRALDALDRHASDDLQDGLRELRIELAELQVTLQELKQVAAAECGRVIDLPNPLRSVN